MIVRSIDATGDWNFGKSLNNYLGGRSAVGQNIATRLRSFLGDCFFDTGAGLDWFNFCGGSKSELALSLAVSAVILNTDFVTGILELNIVLNRATRNCTITYTVATSVSTFNPITPPTIAGSVSLLLTQGGDVLTTQSGSGLEI